jgi:DNA-binding NarL/FixJ family response regulator
MYELDETMLALLRQLLAATRADADRTVPTEEVIRLSQRLHVPGKLVIDLTGTEQLGHPLMVLQLGRRRPAWLSSLTRRESEVAELVAAGLGNKQIAYRLGISLPTVKDHVHRILEKTGLPGRSAVAAALTNGEA